MRILIILSLFTLPVTAMCGDGGTPIRCSGSSKVWNQTAYDDYAHGKFAEALKAVEAASACSWADQQLIFNSYMALYLQKSSPDLKSSALRAVDAFEQTPTWLADPAPLLVTIGEDEKARAWYSRALERLAVDKRNDPTQKPEALRSRKQYFDAAINLMKASDWPAARIDEKLQRLTEAEQDSVRSARQEAKNR